MEFYAYHGCYAAERNIGGTYLVSVSIDADLTAACNSDSVDDTINYESVYQIVSNEMRQPSNLIEHVAYRIRQALLTEFESIEKIAEFLLCFFLGKTEKFENSVLQIGVGNTD